MICWTVSLHAALKTTCAESTSVYAPIVTVAFIQPDFETTRAQVFSSQLHGALNPPVPVSGRQIHIDRFHAIGGGGMSVAVNVTDCGPERLAGVAVTSKTGGFTVTWTESTNVYCPTVVLAFIHPERVTSRLQVLSVHEQPGVRPPLPTSGRQVQLDRVQVMDDGVTDAVNVIESGPCTVAGAAVTSNSGGFTVT